MEVYWLRFLALALLSIHLVNQEAKAVSIQDSLPALVLDEDSSVDVKKSSTGEPAEVQKGVSEVRPQEASTEQPRIEPAEPKVEPPKDNNKTVESITTTSQPPIRDSAESVNSPVGESEDSKKTSTDINTLLANKNDAENDLASPSEPSSTSSTESVQTKSDPPKPSVVDLDSPVETNKPNESNDNRFHYSLGNAESKPASETTTEQAESTTASVDEEKTTTVENKSKDADATSTTQQQTTTEQPPQTSTQLEEKKPESANKDATEEKKVESSQVSTDNPVKETSAEPEVKPVVAESAKPSILDSRKDKDEPTSSTAASTPKIEQPKVEVEKQNDTKVEPNVTTPKTSSENSPVEKVESIEKPTSVLATALGTALGAAVNPLASNSVPKLEPKLAEPSTAATGVQSTTKAPAVVRKSSTDKWENYTPSTPSTSSGPTRRRPILPSIRRRFKPQSGYGYDRDPDYLPSDSDPFTRSTATPTSSKPRRKWGTSIDSSSSDADDKDESPSIPPRRQPSVNNRRRHHHNHHHHHHHGESDVGPLSGRRRHHHHHHHNHHRHRHDERDERPVEEPSSFSDSISPQHNQRPFSPGFSLFGPGSTGSAFDLLNPFAGWLDDIGRPKPARREHLPSVGARPYNSPHRPNPVEGYYNGGHEHRDQRIPMVGLHNGREDFEPNHHRDCHDQSYAHHNHRDGQHQHRNKEGESLDDQDSYFGEESYSSDRHNQPTSVRDRTQSSSRSSPESYNKKRLPSIFSPFDSLFAPLDDEIFGLRSSFVDGTPKSDSTRSFDAVVSSPKISMPRSSRLKNDEQTSPSEDNWKLSADSWLIQ